MSQPPPPPPAGPPPGGQPPPPGYGYGQPQQPQTSSDAIVALVLAILSWAVCPFVMAVVALVFASKASKAIAASNGWLEGAGMVTAAKIIAWINIAFGILMIGFVIILVIVGALNSDLPSDLPTDPADFDALLGLF